MDACECAHTHAHTHVRWKGYCFSYKILLQIHEKQTRKDSSQKQVSSIEPPSNCGYQIFLAIWKINRFKFEKLEILFFNFSFRCFVWYKTDGPINMLDTFCLKGLPNLPKNFNLRPRKINSEHRYFSVFHICPRRISNWY